MSKGARLCGSPPMMDTGQVNRINRMLRRSGWREMSQAEIETLYALGLDKAYGEYSLADMIRRDRR